MRLVESLTARTVNHAQTWAWNAGVAHRLHKLTVNLTSVFMALLAMFLRDRRKLIYPSDSLPLAMHTPLDASCCHEIKRLWEQDGDMENFLHAKGYVSDS